MKHKIGDDVPLDEIELFSFSSEKNLNKLLLQHIDEFMESVFDEKVKSATDKKAQIIGGIKLKTGQLLPKRGGRLDLWVECESGHKYIIEIKNEKNRNYEMYKAIGQLLGYSLMFPQATKLVIVSTSYDDGLDIILKKYNLPIEFVLLTKNSYYLLKK